MNMNDDENADEVCGLICRENIIEEVTRESASKRILLALQIDDEVIQPPPAAAAEHHHYHHTHTYDSGNHSYTLAIAATAVVALVVVLVIASAFAIAWHLATMKKRDAEAAEKLRRVQSEIKHVETVAQQALAEAERDAEAAEKRDAEAAERLRRVQSEIKHVETVAQQALAEAERANEDPYQFHHPPLQATAPLQVEIPASPIHPSKSRSPSPALAAGPDDGSWVTTTPTDDDGYGYESEEGSIRDDPVLSAAALSPFEGAPRGAPPHVLTTDEAAVVVRCGGGFMVKAKGGLVSNRHPSRKGSTQQQQQ